MAVCRYHFIKWAPSSDFVSSSIPSWQISTAHAQPFRGARDLAFCLKVPLDSLLIWANSEGSGETARIRRLAWTFAARIGYKYQIRLTRSKYNYCTCKCIVVKAQLTHIFISNRSPAFVKDCNSMPSATVGQVRVIPFRPSPRIEEHSSSSKSFMNQRNKKGDSQNVNLKINLIFTD